MYFRLNCSWTDFLFFYLTLQGIVSDLDLVEADAVASQAVAKVIGKKLSLSQRCRNLVELVRVDTGLLPPNNSWAQQQGRNQGDLGMGNPINRSSLSDMFAASRQVCSIFFAFFGQHIKILFISVLTMNLVCKLYLPE